MPLGFDMVLKDFQCRVSIEKYDQFSAEQLRWNALETQAGFVAQCGGRSSDDPTRVQIFGVWTDLDSYHRFMSEAHDPIFEEGSQGDCYCDAQSVIYERVIDIPGDEGDLVSALGRDASMIGVARCMVHPSRTEHFIEMQENVWKPGMELSAGMLGGSFWRSMDEGNRFIQTIAWALMEDHERYCQEQLPNLRQRAKPEHDLHKPVGSQILLTPAWTVSRSTD
jgi:heme-degrading monooxygenase HmoA